MSDFNLKIRRKLKCRHILINRKISIEDIVKMWIKTRDIRVVLIISNF